MARTVAWTPADLRWRRRGWHNVIVPLPPWIIQELEEERLRREEEERVRSSRIELPQSSSPPAEEGNGGGARVAVVDISPRDPNVIDI